MFSYQYVTQIINVDDDIQFIFATLYSRFIYTLGKIANATLGILERIGL